MSKKFTSIIASTMPEGYQLDSRRTQFVWTIDAVKEVNRQINLAHDQSQEIKVLLTAPQKGRGGNNFQIGKIISATIVETNKSVTCQAQILIESDTAIKEILEDKKQKCFYPLISYGEKSLKSSIIFMPGDQVNYLQPPLKIIGAYLGNKRSSSNPNLTIL